MDERKDGVTDEGLDIGLILRLGALLALDVHKCEEQVMFLIQC